ncbi:hypothetical protein ACFSWE_12785 [Leucobacter albus]|uniref:Uncharacterized protein n=1 Tax=Leucobacter albus TaxID=272210 RepID=A0ABW3TRN7_9MICO
MKPLRIATFILGAITLIAFVGPFFATGGGELSGVLEFYIGWVIVGPTAGVLTICLGGLVSLVAVHSPEATRTKRWGVAAVWVALFALALLWAVRAQHGGLGGTALSNIPAVLAVSSGIALIAVVTTAFAATVRDAPARRRATRWVTFGALTTVTLVAGLFLLTKQALLAEYGRAAEAAMHQETTLQERERKATIKLATACISLPTAQRRIDETAFYERTQPPVLPEKLAESLRTKAAEAAAGIATFDPAVCEEAATQVEAAIVANGGSLDEFELDSSFLAARIDQFLPPDELPLPQTPSFWAISAQDVAEAKERRAAAFSSFLAVRDIAAPIADEAWATVSLPFHLITGEMRDAMADSAAAVIAETGADGTPEAKALLELTERSSRIGATSFEINEQFSSYLRSASAMLEAAG